MSSPQWGEAMLIEHIKQQISWKRREVGSLKGHLANAEAQLEKLRRELEDAKKPPQRP